MNKPSSVLHDEALDARVEGILRNGVPESLVDRTANEHTIELLELPQIHRPSIVETAESAFTANLVSRYFDDKAGAEFLVERGDSIYKTEIIALPQEFAKYMDILATHLSAQRNGSARAALRAFLSNTEAAYWRSREDRPVNNGLYRPLIRQLRDMGIPADFRLLPTPIDGH